MPLSSLGEEGGGERLVAVVLGASRAPVAAIATGIARGAFERLLRYVSEQRRDGEYLFEKQWVQLALVDMMTKIQMARQLYLDAAMTCDQFGFPKLMEQLSMKLLGLLPQWVMRTPVASRLFTSRSMYNMVRQVADSSISDKDLRFIAGLSSMAKFAATDLAVEVTSRALEVMGEDGPAARWGVEKLYRDAKLTQIYEGTNQINRLYVLKNILM